jgi:hypothetical protein
MSSGHELLCQNQPLLATHTFPVSVDDVQLRDPVDVDEHLRALAERRRSHVKKQPSSAIPFTA